LRKIGEANLPIPTKNQLKNILRKLRLVKFGLFEISLGELVSYCEENAEIPENEDEAFVLRHKIDDEKDIKFNFLVTTKLLCDTTYKLVWQGFPVLVVGTVESTV
jgi:hypothetical protein